MNLIESIPARLSVTSRSAMAIPRAQQAMAFQNLIPNKKASRHPVHAPVPGRGIDTKIIKKGVPHF